MYDIADILQGMLDKPDARRQSAMTPVHPPAVFSHVKQGIVVEDLPGASAWLAQALQDAFPGIAVRTAASVAEGLALLKALSPDIALVDLGLPDAPGIRLIEVLNREHPACHCVVTTIFADDVHLFPALRAGAQGYLLKDEPRERITQALQGIVAGEPPLSPAIARRLLKVFTPVTAEVAPDVHLSPRERETLTLIAKGYKLPDVAQQLSITRNTAAGFIKSVYRKLNVSSRAEATLEAARMGLVKAEL